jgi:hypothetical protein
MNELFVQELNKLTKWLILHNVSFIGHELIKFGLFSIIKIGDVHIHLEIFFNQYDTDATVNCYSNNKLELSTFGTLEECLSKVDKILKKINYV